MKTKNLHLASLLILFSFFILAIASIPSQKSLTVDAGAIPPDFKGYKGVLLIQSQTKGWNKYAKKYFASNYNGEYLFIKGDVDKLGYTDKSKYRFFLFRKLYVTEHYDPSSINNRSRTSSESLYMLDRMTGKTYHTPTTSFFGKLLKGYSTSLEKTRTGD